jgi:hypothetical protein
MAGRVVAVGVLLTATKGAAQPAAAPDSAEPTATASSGRYGAEVFGEYFPTQRQQQSVYTGARFRLYIHDQVAIVLDGGYVAAGRQAGNGDDGLALGGGIEVGLALPHAVPLPFLRLKWDHVIKQTSDLPAGSLRENAAMISAGLRFGRSVDVHLNYGSTYSGALTLGLGLALGLNL